MYIYVCWISSLLPASSSHKDLCSVQNDTRFLRQPRKEGPGGDPRILTWSAWQEFLPFSGNRPAKDGQACPFPGPEGQILGDTCALYAGLPAEVSPGDTEVLTFMEGLWLQRLARRTRTLNVITQPCRENHALPLPQGGNLWVLWTNSPWMGDTSYRAGFTLSPFLE